MASDPAAVRAYFENFEQVQAPQSGSPLYQVLSRGVLDDSKMLTFACRCPPSQPPANLLFASVHSLLLAGERHPLGAFYPDVVGADNARAASAEAYGHFRDFVWERRDSIEELLLTRLVQTNVVRRTTCMLPAFASVAAPEQPLALLEIGTSAGLNLHWDRYGHSYTRDGETVARWGDPSSALQLSTELRAKIPAIPPELSVAWRCGLDLDPIDVADPERVLWLRALVFPEHVERHGEIEAACAIARAHPVSIERGDASTRLAELAARAPGEAALCVYASMVMNQIPQQGREQIRSALEALGRERATAWLTLDGRGEGWATLRLTRFASQPARRETLGTAHPHGRWLAWGSEGAL